MYGECTCNMLIHGSQICTALGSNIFPGDWKSSTFKEMFKNMQMIIKKHI